MYKLKTSSSGSDDLSIGFDRSRDRRQRELTHNKIEEGNFHLRSFLNDTFAFAEHQKTGTFGLGYKLTLIKSTDNAVLNKDNAINNAKIKVNALESYVPHYTISLEEENILLKQILKKTLTELHYPERSVFMTENNTQNYGTFESGAQKNNFPVWIYVVFQQSEKQHDQNLNNDSFFRMPVPSAQCIIGTEKYPDSAILLSYDDNDSFQGYGQRKEAFRTLREDDLLQPYITEDDFRSSNDGDKIGYNMDSFDMNYQKNFESAQPVKVDYKIDGVVPAGIYGYA